MFTQVFVCPQQCSGSQGRATGKADVGSRGAHVPMGRVTLAKQNPEAAKDRPRGAESALG